jgi:hypothetical protein
MNRYKISGTSLPIMQVMKWGVTSHPIVPFTRSKANQLCSLILFTAEERLLAEGLKVID